MKGNGAIWLSTCTFNASRIKLFQNYLKNLLKITWNWIILCCKINLSWPYLMQLELTNEDIGNWNKPYRTNLKFGIKLYFRLKLAGTLLITAYNSFGISQSMDVPSRPETSTIVGLWPHNLCQLCNYISAVESIANRVNSWLFIGFLAKLPRES